ncbi:hypothetical protein P154DRAFT_559961 [Amniculicola lignicola CBS 123094]|uniref:Ecp2 effector protein domain-containing protein n=1 Tax=Amniculicola lignicola CBS 123094 TaxID=1392246 RepID=A0A6A5WV30_9PLEO|nr:hypothetical protein P154DRAFT_559961 [Amniculicola lignicola CBS 123094]
MSSTWKIFSIIIQCSFVLAQNSQLPSTFQSEVPGQTVVVTTIGTQTWNQTFIPTSLSQYATITSPTTITTTDTAGQIIVIKVLAGGLAWWAIPKPGAPLIKPPQIPLQIQPTKAPDLSKTEDTKPSASVTSETTSSSSLRPHKTQIAWVQDVGKVNWKHFWGQIPVALPERQLKCSFPNDDPAIFEANDAHDRVRTFCKEKNGQKLSIDGNDADGTGVTRKEVLADIESFCKRIAGKELPGEGGISGTHYQLAGDSSAVLEAFYDRGCESEEGKAKSYTVDERSCVRFLSRAAQECNTHDPTSNKTWGGEVVDTGNCAKFYLSTNLVETYGCTPNEESIWTPVHGIKMVDAERAIDAYCNEDLTLDLNYQSDGQFHEKPPKGVSNWNFIDGIDYRIHMTAMFVNGTTEDNCWTKRPYSTKGEECKRKLRKAMSNCDGRAIAGLRDKTPNGCTQWIIAGSVTSNTS